MIHLQLIHTTGDNADVVSNMIHNIWPAPYAKDAELATREDGFKNPTGDVFAIVYMPSSGYSPRVIGLTGYFMESAGDSAYLRWTGIRTAFRHNGHVREALRQLTLILKAANPGLCKLIELVPDNNYGHIVVVPAFEKLGFVSDRSISVPTGEDADWAVIPYVLNF